MTSFTIVVKDGKNKRSKDIYTETLYELHFLFFELSPSVCKCRLHFEVLDYTDLCIGTEFKPGTVVDCHHCNNSVCKIFFHPK